MANRLLRFMPRVPLVRKFDRRVTVMIKMLNQLIDTVGQIFSIAGHDSHLAPRQSLLRFQFVTASQCSNPNLLYVRIGLVKLIGK